MSLSRLKLLHALIFFSTEVLYPGKTKTFKLLNYLDFLHFQKTGRSVTGMDYYAWPEGPVPVALFEEYDQPRPDFHSALTIQKKGQMVALKPRIEFNADYFSDLELKIMKDLTKKHFRHTGKEMSEGSHFKTGPWHEVREVKGQKQGRIPYDLTLQRRGNAEDLAMLEYARISDAVRKNFN